MCYNILKTALVEEKLITSSSQILKKLPGRILLVSGSELCCLFRTFFGGPNGELRPADMFPYRAPECGPPEAIASSQF